MKKVTRTAAAAFVSFGLVGTFALPAYANLTSDEVQYSSEPTQALVTSNASAASFDLTALATVEDPALIAERERLADEERDRIAAQVAEDSRQVRDEQAAEPAAPGPNAADIAAGASAGGISGAALAQLGVSQDCTDLVQNSLAAMGKDTRRDQGGYDRGTGVGDWAGFGSVLGGGGSYAVGDILIWPGQHVAIYIGDGKAVHGGWFGNQTVVHDLTLYGAHPSSVVRPS